MSDMICRKNMMRCQTPSMCAPFGGCRDESVPSVAAICAERDALAQRCRELEHMLKHARMDADTHYADALTLRAEVERLRKALAPFAKCADVFDSSEYVGVFYEWKRPDGEYELTVADLRTARAAMEPKP